MDGLAAARARADGFALRHRSAGLAQGEFQPGPPVRQGFVFVVCHV
jgi:hypothetical protein